MVTEYDPVDASVPPTSRGRALEELMVTLDTVIASPAESVFACRLKPPPLPVLSPLLSACVVVIVPPPTEKLAARTGAVRALVPRQKMARRVSAFLRIANMI